jgi:hypothetical protein
MKPIRKMLKVVVAMSLLGSAVALATNFDVEIHCVPEKVDESANPGSGHKATAKEHWRYEVTIENKTFKDLGSLEIKYVIFFKQEKLGMKAEATPRRQSGGTTIDLIKPHEKKSFGTDPIELNKSHLVGRYHYTSGAKINVQDTLDGLWIRVYQNGQQLAEYANPSTLTKEQWQ